MADRIFTHAVPQSAGQLQTRHFQKQAQGIHNGVRLTQIESQHPAVDRNYRHAIMVERADGQGQPQIFFGSYQDINSLATELRQGSVYFQAFSSDLRSESLLSPLSGYVSDINEELLKHPDEYLDDPYGKGWLIKISPSNFDEEIKILGL